MRRPASTIVFNRRILSSLKRRIREVEGPEDYEVVEYYHPYSEELGRVHTRTVKREDFLQICATSPVVLVGDYHTLDQAQRTFLGLLQDLEARRVKPVVVLEMLSVHHEKPVARYLAGKLSDGDFLESIHYFDHWGFDYTHYKPIFEHARTYRLPLHGLNRDGSLAERDQFMASRLLELRRIHKGRPLFVLVGDLHLASQHLPDQLASLGIRATVLFQNSETVYMRKLEARENPFGWWSLGSGRYLNNNTPPAVKLTTYLTWLEHGSEALQMLYGFRGPGNHYGDEGDTDLSETVGRFVKVLKHLFDLHLRTDDDYQVYMYNDLEFLKDSYFMTAQGKASKAMILDGRAVYIHSNRTIYLPVLDVNRTVQEAMHYLMRTGMPAGHSLASFFLRIHYFASGYLASKVVNPMRHSPSLQEMEKAIHTYRWLKDESQRRKLWRQLDVYRHTLEFMKIARSHRRGLLLQFTHMLKVDERSVFALSEQIGRTVGDDICRRYDSGQLSAVDLKYYIFSQSDPLYFERQEAEAHASGA